MAIKSLIGIQNKLFDYWIPASAVGLPFLFMVESVVIHFCAI